MEENWFAKNVADVIKELGTSEHGLNRGQAKERLKQYGLNKLPEAKAENIFIIFLRQFQSPLIYILLGASVVTFLMGEYVDGFVILFVLFFNATVGTIQEGRAQNTLLALKKFIQTETTVVRDGKEYILPDTDLVPGDIIMLREGEKVPGDARIIHSGNLTVDESVLTGESVPVHKFADPLGGAALTVGEQKNMVFRGTNLVAGNGRAIVVATGLQTQIGRISKTIQSIESEIPLKADIRRLARLIVVTTAAICISLLLVGTYTGVPLRNMFALVISLSVSIVPEGLPVVMTLVLATGVWRMARRNALVKRLQAVEALGQARVIAVDKTGTLTKNELMVAKVYVGGDCFDVGGSGYEPKGEISKEGQAVEPLNHKELLLAGKVAAFASGARISYLEESHSWKVSGDPTEAALLVFAQKVGFERDILIEEAPLVFELPFDYKKKYHATVHEAEGKGFVSVVGAPEVVLEFCKRSWRGGRAENMEKEERQALEERFLLLSREGLRVVAFAFLHDKIAGSFSEKSWQNLIFGGFFAMRDVLRPEVRDAVLRTLSSGIRVVMITGDFKATAEAIAKEAGIMHEGDLVLTGSEVDKMTDDELAGRLGNVSVFARVTPEHKFRLVQAYKKRGEIVAMTGDGVNDAPSLVAADLGIAMGKIGTEVAKEASDIVLLDDNFTSITAAIEEGRSIYKTIKKVILYLFSTSIGEVLTIGGAIFLGYPLPVLPVQIIWLNLVTDGFLDVSLGMEPKEKGLLGKKFERPHKFLVDSLMAQRMVFMAIPMAIGSLVIFREYYLAGDLVKAMSMTLTVLAVFQWFNAWNCRSEEKSIFQMSFWSNKFLLGATFITITLQFLAIYTPLLQKVLHTTSLTAYDWLRILPIGLSIVVVEELRKILYRQWAGRRDEGKAEADLAGV